jgi:YVTN family beta-propeller protein
LQFKLLGPLEAFEGGRSLDLGGSRQRALLTVLLLRRREVVTIDRLIDELWGERAPPTAAKTVHVYVSRLRKELGEGLIVTRGRGYVAAVEPGQLDLDLFDSLIVAGRSALDAGEFERAVGAFAEALGLWRGEPLADFAYEGFAQPEIARLSELRLAAIEDRIEAALALGHHRQVIAELESHVATHPNRERLLGQLMLALYRCGRQADALEAYQRGRRALSAELGLEPGPQLRALESAIIQHDPALAGTPDPHEPASATVDERPSAQPAERRAAQPDALGSARPARRAPRIRPRRAIVAGVTLLLVAVVAALAERGGGTSVRVQPNSIEAIDAATGRLVAAVSVGSGPGSLAFGAGSLWVANLNDQTISRIDPGSLRTLRTIPVADPPTSIVAAAGALWLVESNPTQEYVSVARLDPEFDTARVVARVGDVVADSPAALVAQGSSLWVAPSFGDVSRLDMSTQRVTAHFDPDASPAGLAVGFGAEWVTDSDAGTVTRIDPTGLTTPIPVGDSPSGIAVGAGSVWVADTADDAVVRINPVTRSVTSTIKVGAAPSGIAVGDGAVWVADGGSGAVTRIDPATDRVSGVTAVGGSPQQLAIVGGRVWVSVDPSAVASRARATGGTLRVDSRFDVDYLDPALAYTNLSWQILYASCAKLLNYPDRPGQAGSELVPEVAQSLPVTSDGGRVYTFRIRPGFRFAPPSGQPVTAETFKDTIERTLNPRMKSPVADEFLDVVGARAYEAGRAAHISGVVASGKTLQIRLLAPAPDLPERLAQPFFCAVPTDTPVDPSGVRVIPSAGPYTVSSYVPGQGIVLVRNPNYRGQRPRSFSKIEIAVGVPTQTALSSVQAGTADYADNPELLQSSAASLAARYGARSKDARDGHQQFFAEPLPWLDYLVLNTHRPLFADARMRLAVSDAIDRRALAALGDPPTPLPEPASAQYLPPGVPGHQTREPLPLTPNLSAARKLAAGHAGASVVLYTCDVTPCQQQAKIIQADLARIGLRVVVDAFPLSALFNKESAPNAPFDIADTNWEADYPDPDNFLNELLESGTFLPTFVDPRVSSELAAAARLKGAQRFLVYGRLAVEIARREAPLVVFGNPLLHDLFSARTGCQVYGRYGLDLAALCIRPAARH